MPPRSKALSCHLISLLTLAMYLTSAISDAQSSHIGIAHQLNTYLQNEAGGPSLYDNPFIDETRVRWELAPDPSGPRRSFRVEYGENRGFFANGGTDLLNMQDGTVRFVTLDQAERMAEVTLTLSIPSQLDPPRVTNLQRLVESAEGSEYLLVWDSIPGATTSDYIRLNYDPLQFGGWYSVMARGSSIATLEGTATSYIIPKGLELTNQVVITFIKVSDQQTDPRGELTGIAAVSAQTVVGFSSRPEPPNTNAPTLVYVSPEVGETNVATRETVIQFGFSQPMSRDLAIAWSTNVEAGRWTFEWWPDGEDEATSLTCIYADRLPANAVIEWTLNPAEMVGPGFAGINGVELGEIRGSFRTAAVGVSNIWYIGAFVSRSFIQEGLTDPVEDIEPFSSASLFSGLAGEPTNQAIATVRLPDGSILDSTSDGTSGYDGFEIEIEALTDLFENYPDGEYLFTYESDGGGPVQAGFKINPADELPPPRITNLSAAQSIDSTKDFVLRWEAQVGSDYDFFQQIEVVRSDRGLGPEAEPTANECVPGSYVEVKLLPTDRQLVLPARALLPGATYSCTLLLGREVLLQSSLEGAAPHYEGAFLDFEHRVLFTIQTSGNGCESRVIVVSSRELQADPQQSIQFPLQASGGAPPYRWELIPGSTLPTGASLRSDGMLQGIATETGEFHVGVRVRDSAPDFLDIEAGVTGTGIVRLIVGTTVPVQPPVLTLIPTSAGERLAFSFPTVAGRSYQIQAADDLRAWTTVETVTGAGATREFRVGSTPANIRRFYRVLMP